MSDTTAAHRGDRVNHICYLHRQQSRLGYGFYLHLSVCLSSVFLHGISTTDAARITKLDTEMFRDESWKSIYFGVKRSDVKSRVAKNIVGVGPCILVSAGFF